MDRARPQVEPVTVPDDGPEVARGSASRTQVTDPSDGPNYLDYGLRENDKNLVSVKSASKSIDMTEGIWLKSRFRSTDKMKSLDLALKSVLLRKNFIVNNRYFCI